MEESTNIRRTADVSIEGDTYITRTEYKGSSLIGNDYFWVQMLLCIQGIEPSEQITVKIFLVKITAKNVKTLLLCQAATDFVGHRMLFLFAFQGDSGIGVVVNADTVFLPRIGTIFVFIEAAVPLVVKIDAADIVDAIWIRVGIQGAYWADSCLNQLQGAFWANIL